MKKTNIILSGALIVFALIAVAGKFHIDTFNVDAKQSNLEWFAKKVSGKHNGTIMLKGGQIQNNHGTITGYVEIDMTTITNKDIENAEPRTKLENHLKSADFFDVKNYPTSKFVIKSMVPLTEAKEGFTHKVTGDLTIKDKTNEISFDATIGLLPGKVTCTGSAVVDRAKFDVKYGSRTFFADIGDKMIDDEFTLKFNVVALK